MAKKSAGILVYRFLNHSIQFLLVHPGGPFWAKKDMATWSIPKGEYEDAEEALVAAKREFFEETGWVVSGNFIALKPVKLKSGKIVSAWAIEGDFDCNSLVSNYCEISWPPQSGKKISIPEVDKADWFFYEMAKEKINVSQIPLLDEIIALLSKD